MKLEGSLEENILTLICWDNQHAPTLALRLKAELFSTRAYRKIAQTALEYQATYNRAPRAHLRDVLEDALRKGDEGRFIGQTLDAVELLAKDIQPEFVLAQLEQFISMRTLTAALENASDALASGDVAQARAIMQEGNALPQAGSPGIWLSDPDRMLGFLDHQDEEYISCGIDELDARDIRLERKTMTAFVAPAKRGKSWWCVEVGKRAILHGKKVLHISLENSEKLTAKRYVQALFAMTARQAQVVRTAVFVKDAVGLCTGVNFEDRTPDVLATASRAGLIKRLRGFKNKARFLIKEFPTGSLTVAELNAYLDHLERAHDFIPDVMIVDYPNLMAINAANLRLELGQLFKKLRGIFVARNIAGAVVTQGSKVAANARVVTSSMVAEDFSIIGTADTVLTYSQTSDERKLGLARILVSEARDAEDKYIVLISQAYATGQFCLDSVYMSKFMETEVERLTGDGTPNDEED